MSCYWLSSLLLALLFVTIVAPVYTLFTQKKKLSYQLLSLRSTTVKESMLEYKLLASQLSTERAWKMSNRREKSNFKASNRRREKSKWKTSNRRREKSKWKTISAAATEDDHNCRVQSEALQTKLCHAILRALGEEILQDLTVLDHLRHTIKNNKNATSSRCLSMHKQLVSKFRQKLVKGTKITSNYKKPMNANLIVPNIVYLMCKRTKNTDNLQNQNF